MTRVRIDLFTSLDGHTPADPTPENPMGADFGRLTEAFVSTRTFRERHGEPGGKGTTGVDDRYAAAFFEGVGSEIMGAGMFGLHAYPDDANWKGWWGDKPPFGTPVYVLTHTAPRPSIPMEGGTTFHFRSAAFENVLAEASEAAGGLDVRVGGGYSTARDFLRAGLVDDLHLSVTPIFLGQGNRLWDELRGFELNHNMTTEVAESGTIHVNLKR
jgi:dihydrofolate reductase